MRLGVARFQREGARPVAFGLRPAGRAVCRYCRDCYAPRIVGLQRQHPFQAKPAFLEFSGFLQDDAEIVPGARQRAVHGHRAPRRRLAFGQQALLAAHLGEIADIHGRRPRRLARFAQLADRQVQIAIGMRHQSEQMQRIGLARPNGQDTLA